MTKSERIPMNKARNLMRNRAVICHSGFEIPSTFVIRISSLANVFSGLAQICNA